MRRFIKETLKGIGYAYLIMLGLALIGHTCKAQAPGTRVRLFEKPDDTAYHVWAGMAIGSAAGAVAYKITKRPGLSTFYAWLAAVMAGAAKEIINDKLMNRGTPSGRDFINTGWGACVSVPIVRCGIDIHEKRKLDREFFEHYSDSLQFQRSCDTISLPTPIKLD